jgi:glycosyltransferase involved in cell wall biosynthesis
MKFPASVNIKSFITTPLFDEDVVCRRNDRYPGITVVMPSYNQGNFLERTILSVLNQNYPNLEFIIIDGRSSDGSVEIIKKYEKYLAYWTSEKDLGQSDALNKGFAMASGEIIGWQNSDDIYLPGAFSRAAGVFRDFRAADVVYGNRLDIDEQDHVIGESRFTRFSPVVFMYDGMSLGTQSTFFRRGLLEKTGTLDVDLNFAMDYDFFLRAAGKGACFKYVPFYFGAMRRHENAKTEIYLGTGPHRKELSRVDERHGRIRSLNPPFRIYSLLFRSIHYFLQGDGDYVWNGVKRRIRNIRN